MSLERAIYLSKSRRQELSGIYPGQLVINTRTGDTGIVSCSFTASASMYNLVGWKDQPRRLVVGVVDPKGFDSWWDYEDTQVVFDT